MSVLNSWSAIAPGLINRVALGTFRDVDLSRLFIKKRKPFFCASVHPQFSRVAPLVSASFSLTLLSRKLLPRVNASKLSSVILCYIYEGISWKIPKYLCMKRIDRNYLKLLTRNFYIQVEIILFCMILIRWVIIGGSNETELIVVKMP